jgi:hypothetical protein
MAHARYPLGVTAADSSADSPQLSERSADSGNSTLKAQGFIFPGLDALQRKELGVVETCARHVSTLASSGSHAGRSPKPIHQ